MQEDKLHTPSSTQHLEQPTSPSSLCRLNTPQSGCCFTKTHNCSDSIMTFAPLANLITSIVTIPMSWFVYVDKILAYFTKIMFTKC